MIHGGYMHFYAGPGWVARFLFLLLLLAILAAAATAVYLLIHQRTASPGGPPAQQQPASSEAARILDERFARGEIDDEEYQRRRTVLRSTT